MNSYLLKLHRLNVPPKKLQIPTWLEKRETEANNVYFFFPLKEEEQPAPFQANLLNTELDCIQLWIQYLAQYF